jgi:predicted nucleotide-binding protein
MWLSGKEKMKNLINTMLEDLELSFTHHLGEGEKPEIRKKVSKRIFIVHGKDEEMKQAVARVLEKLELEPIILHEQPDKGQTIIEKLIDYSDVNFAIVLLSPDDIFSLKSHLSEETKKRARQNVIFELGFFIGKLGRENVVAVYREEKNFEMPSDYSGVVYIPYDDSGQWQNSLIKELKACGYDVDANKLFRHLR